MSEYDIALDAKMDWASFWASNEGRRLWNGISELTAHMRQEKGEKSTDYIVDHQYDELAITLVSLYHGDCYYWSRDMMDMIKIAANSLPGSWSLMKEHIPSVSGFFYFAKELEDHEVGFAWNTLTINPDDMDHSLTGKMAAIHLPHEDGTMPDFNGISLVIFARHPELAHPLPARTSLYVGESLDDWKNKMGLAIAEINADAADFKGFYENLRLFGTMLSFLQQRIMVHSREYVSRPAKRRAQAVNEAVKPEVNVVRLRKAVYRSPQGEGREIDWSCRWIVHGHWRNQWYATERRHHPVFISPFIKGPADKPLRDPGRLFAVVR